MLWIGTWTLIQPLLGICVCSVLVYHVLRVPVPCAACVCACVCVCAMCCVWRERLFIIIIIIIITIIIIIKRRSGINPIPPTVKDHDYKKKQKQSKKVSYRAPFSINVLFLLTTLCPSLLLLCGLLSTTPPPSPKVHYPCPYPCPYPGKPLRKYSLIR